MTEKQVDYIEHLKPIIEDVKDGEDKLCQEDVDFIMTIIRAKIEFSEGLITESEYTDIMNNTR